MSLETLWIGLPGCQDVFPSVVSFLASCILLTDSESRKFIFIGLSFLYVCFQEISVALMLYKFMLCWSTIRLIVYSVVYVCEYVCVCVCVYVCMSGGAFLS